MATENTVYERINDFGSVRISLASPNDIRSWSFGEVRKPETINYRTYRAERDGLFCERIFGPERDWECFCGKYKGTKHKGMICDRCGVKVTHSRVRRKRMGHINLAAPVVHIWFFKAMPSRLGTLLDMKVSDLEKVVYFQDYIVVDPGPTPLKYKQLLTEEEYRAAREKYGAEFDADMGAEACKKMLQRLDMAALSTKLREELDTTRSKQKVKNITKRLKLVEALRESGNQPDWMVLDVIPVIPPDLRPLVLLDSGNFATSDLNDLYRRIINRNNRLKKIKALHAPESIINHEKRLLQEAVDALVDNGRRSRPVTGSNNRPLKSLSDMLKGKEGRFRKNLLGKRVDYSGRSVIVVNPNLKLHQCGLPKEMALELFKPFVMKRLVERGFTTNVKTAKKMVDRMRSEVWDALEEVIQDHPIMLNRAPTLHRLGIQAFEPVLVDGKAIQIHPLVCLPFNADFDGDQMAVHVPLSTAAQAEARILMMSTENLFSPADGRPMVTPTRDIILGCYYLTQKRDSAQGSKKDFANSVDARLAYEMRKLDLHADIRVRVDGALMDTTVGRIIFNEVLPPKLRYVSRVVDERELSRLVRECYRHYGTARTVQLVDDLKALGFRFATRAGITISMTDMDIPRARREDILARTEADVQKVNDNFAKGLISAGERSDTVCRLWNQASDAVSRAILENIDPFNPIYMMANSGARGTPRQITQIAGMRGLMSDPFGRFIEDLPIKSNFHEGLNVLEYFVSTHGARKGLADTALRTADAGYLTRRLVDVAQDVIVRKPDCGTANGIWVAAIRDGAEEIEPLERRIDGRIVPQDVTDPHTDRVILKEGQEISENTDQPCLKCGGDLENYYQCQSCGELVGETGLTERYLSRHAVMQDLEAEEQDAAGREEETSAEEAEPLLEASDNGDGEPDDAKETAAQAEKEDDFGVELGATAMGQAPTTLLLEESSCADCGGAFELIKVCAGCGERSAGHEVVPALTAIKRVVEDCETFHRLVRNLEEGEPAPSDLTDPFTGKLIVERGKVVRGTHAAKLRKLSGELWDKGGLAQGQVLVRSALSCELSQGICARCYGRDFATNTLVEVGEAAGIIAAQSIGEPGTQLTMRTFHTGGVAGQYLTGVAQVKEKKKDTLKQLWGDVKAGIVRLNPREEAARTKKRRSTRKKKSEKAPSRRRGLSLDPDQKRVIQQLVRVMEEQVKGLLRVVELFEARRPKGQAIVSEADGTVAKIETPGVKWVIIHSEQPVDADHPERLYGEVVAENVTKKDGEVLVEAGQELTPALLATLIQAKVRTVNIERRHLVPYRGLLPVKEGDVVRAGDALTEGPLDPQKVLQMQGVRAAQDYLVREIQAVYRSHGVDINDKHIEVIVRQMLRKRRIVDPGDTVLLPGKIYDRFHFDQVNREIRERGGQEATGEWVMLGITEASLATDSWLSAASFQKTTRVLTEAAIQGKIDHLVGLKENVIIGRLIPAGTGMTSYRNLRVQGPPGEIALYAAPDREAELLRSAFGGADFAGPEEELIRDLADVKPPTEDEKASDEDAAAI